MAVAVVPVIAVVGILAPPSRSGPLSEGARALVGHWRKTTIVFEGPQDEHLVLNADGTVENWVVTASHRSSTAIGTWKVEGKILTLRLADNGEVSNRFTIWGTDYFGRGQLRIAKGGQTLSGTWGYSKAINGAGSWQLRHLN
jgi:hypothetical protein